MNFELWHFYSNISFFQLALQTLSIFNHLLHLWLYWVSCLFRFPTYNSLKALLSLFIHLIFFNAWRIFLSKFSMFLLRVLVWIRTQRPRGLTSILIQPVFQNPLNTSFAMGCSFLPSKRVSSTSLFSLRACLFQIWSLKTSLIHNAK